MDFEKVVAIATTSYLERGREANLIAVEGTDQSFVASLIEIPNDLRVFARIFWHLGNQIGKMERLGEFKQAFMVLQETIVEGDYPELVGQKVLLMTSITATNKVEYRIFQVTGSPAVPALSSLDLDFDQELLRLPMLQAFIEGYRSSQAAWN